MSLLTYITYWNTTFQNKAKIEIPLKGHETLMDYVFWLKWWFPQGSQPFQERPEKGFQHHCSNVLSPINCNKCDWKEII